MVLCRNICRRRCSDAPVPFPSSRWADRGNYGRVFSGKLLPGHPVGTRPRSHIVEALGAPPNSSLQRTRLRSPLNSVSLCGRTMTAEWFRQTEWNDSAERAFEEKLGRARRKAQYLRIQACTLAQSEPV